MHGRIDDESLGMSLHKLGDCLSSAGQYAEARPWYERAVAEKEKGDVYGPSTTRAWASVSIGWATA